MNREVLEIIEERRRKNESDRLDRLRDLEERSPKFRDLESRQNALYARASLERVRGELTAYERTIKKAKAIDLEKKQVLAELGLSPDYLEVRYTCPYCQDRGFLKNGEKCRCFKELLRQRYYNRYDLTEYVKEENFGTLDESLFSDSSDVGGITPRQLLRMNANYLWRFCKEFNEVTKSVYLSGPVGTGKTFLVNCVVNELLKDGIGPIYLSAPNLILLLYEDVRSNLNRYLRDFIDSKLLIIDDLGTETQSNFSKNMLSQIVDERQLKKHPTIITSNYPVDELSRHYPERMASRIQGFYQALNFVGEDLRIVKRQRNLMKEDG